MTRIEALKLLRLSEPFSAMQLVKAYRRAALKAHPDHRSGSDKRFIAVTTARDVLTGRIAEKRRIIVSYDWSDVTIFWV